MTVAMRLRKSHSVERQLASGFLDTVLPGSILYTHIRRDHLQPVSQVLDLLPVDDLLNGVVPPVRRPPQPPPRSPT